MAVDYEIFKLFCCLIDYYLPRKRIRFYRIQEITSSSNTYSPNGTKFADCYHRYDITIIVYLLSEDDIICLGYVHTASD